MSDSTSMSRSILRSITAVLTLLTALLIVTASASASTKPFAPSSFWYQPVNGTQTIDPKSKDIVNNLVGQVSKYGGTWINTTQYTTPVFEAPANAPIVPVIGDFWTPSLKNAFLSGVPLPANAKPSAGTDGHFAVYQKSTDQYWEFWRLHKGDDGLWHAGWGGYMAATSQQQGIFPAPLGAAASGLPLIGGLMRIDEFQSWDIGHELAITVPEVTSNTFRWPATRTDGTAGTGGIQMGTRFRLDPKFDVWGSTTLSLPAKIVAYAAQKYGVVVRDHGGMVSFYGEDPSLLDSNPWPAMLGNQSASQAMKNFPWDRMQVLAVPKVL